MNAPSTGAPEAADAAWPSGPLIRPAAWEAMLQAWPGRRLRQGSIRKHRSLVAELAAQGWVDAGGRLTGQSRDVLRAAANPTSTWQATGHHRGMTTGVRIYCGADGATLSVGPDAAALRGASGDHAPVEGAELPVAIRTLDNSEVPTLLCAWAGLRPGTPSAGHRLELPVPVFTARAHGSAGSPPREFEGAHELWNDDWFVWVVTTPTGSEHGFIGTVGHGNFAFGQVIADGVPAIRLVPLRSGEIWRALKAEDRR